MSIVHIYSRFWLIISLLVYILTFAFPLVYVWVFVFQSFGRWVSSECISEFYFHSILLFIYFHLAFGLFIIVVGIFTFFFSFYIITQEKSIVFSCCHFLFRSILFLFYYFCLQNFLFIFILLCFCKIFFFYFYFFIFYKIKMFLVLYIPSFQPPI